MIKVLLFSLALIAAALADGPTVPYNGFNSADCEGANHLVVDNSNMCWYHQCVDSDNRDDTFTLLPRRCALGTKISYNFVDAFTNPCTINFDSPIGYECDRDRPSTDGPPACFTRDEDRQECFNEGVLVYESNYCWCQCPATWQGDFDCSKPTRQVGELPPGSDICVDGEPLADHCAIANGGCLNGGICFNQCNDYWCDCPNHEEFDYWGKRCEFKP